MYLLSSLPMPSAEKPHNKPKMAEVRNERNSVCRDGSSPIWL